MKKHIPNTLTICNLLSGGVGLILLHQGLLWEAAGMILVGAVFDVFDGLSARLLNVSSAIGAQLDSLADMVSFGVLPAMLSWHMLSALELSTTWPISYLGLAIAAGTALRLARFNVEDDHSRDFRGLPSPASALLICGVALAHKAVAESELNIVIQLALPLALALLMNSTWTFFSLKALSLKTPLGKIKAALLVVFAILILLYQALGLALALSLYIFASITISIARPNELQRRD